MTVALVVALAVASLWVLTAFQQTGTGFVRTILWEQSATRVVHSIAHARPWWFYLLVFPLLLLPWLVWPTAWRSLRGRGNPRADRLAVATFLPAFLIFSLISGKQPHYLLPLVPIVALWLAPRLARPAMTLGSAVPVALCFLFLGAGAAATAIWAEPVNTRLATGFATMACALLFLGGSTERFAALRHVALATATTMGLVTIAFYLAIGESYRLDAAARVVRQLDADDVPIAWIGPYAGQFNFLARLRHPITELDSQRTDDVAAWIAAHPDGQVVAFSSYGCDIDIGPATYRQRYRSGWLVIVPANATHYAPRACDAAKGRADEASSE
jgi:4-amino-4-deoxy-L-arabinose transferase-like glycosyltransferase